VSASARPAGVVVDAVTPMTAAGDVDLGGLVRLLRRLAAAGAGALVVGHEAGEAASLAEEERQAVWETALAAVGDRLPVWVSLAALPWPRAARLARAAEEMGAAGAALLVGGDGEGDGWREMVRAVAAACGLPLLVVERAGRGAHDASRTLAELMREGSGRIAVVPSPAGLAYAACAAAAAGAVALAPEVDRAPAGAALGAAGTLSALAGLWPAAVASALAAVAAGDGAAARAALDPLWPWLWALRRHGPAAVVKYGLARLGEGVGLPRPPLAPLPATAAQALEASLAGAALRAAG
jgi:dihydrodipicolinate synthase/N-acetylneuraminate lyase